MKKNLDIDFNIVGKKILMVEHNDRNYYLSERIFSHTGIKYFRVQRSLEALRMTLKAFDLVLMNLLSADCFFVAQKIKILKPDLPVIVHSSSFIEEDKQKFIDAGCNGFLFDPLQKESTISEIKKCLTTKSRKPQYTEAYF
jgi:CheY-like chemotaxis protein